MRKVARQIDVSEEEYRKNRSEILFPQTANLSSPHKPPKRRNSLEQKFFWTKWSQVRTQERLFFNMKKCSISKQCLTNKMIISLLSLLYTFLTPCERFSVARNRPRSWCGPLFPNHGSPLSFLFYEALKSILIPTLRQFWLLPLQRLRNTSRKSHSHSNKMMLHHTRTTKLKNGARTIFLISGARKFGRLHYQTWVQWTFVFDSFWKQMLVLHPMIQLRRWKALSRKHGTKYSEKPYVKR